MDEPAPVADPDARGPVGSTSGAPQIGAGERAAVTALVVVASALAAVVECFLVPFRVGTTLVPLSLVLVVGLSPFLCQLALIGTGSRLALALPPVVWLLVVIPLGTRRAEGDVVIPGGNWVSTALLLLGAATFAVSIAAQLSGPGVLWRWRSRR